MADRAGRLQRVLDGLIASASSPAINWRPTDVRGRYFMELPSGRAAVERTDFSAAGLDPGYRFELYSGDGQLVEEVSRLPGAIAIESTFGPTLSKGEAEEIELQIVVRDRLPELWAKVRASVDDRSNVVAEEFIRDLEERTE